MHFQAVIFDLDGTLLDTLADIGDAANRVLAARGLPVHPLARYREFIGEGVARLMTRVLPENHCDDATLQACVAAYRDEYARNWNVRTRPYPGVPEMLDALAARGLRLAVVSNKPDVFTQRCVRELLSPWRFDAILGASEALPRKPDPAGALEAARRMAAAPTACLYVGDSGIDMQTARNAGMTSVGVLWGFRDRAELEREGARFLIAQPSELLGLLGPPVSPGFERDESQGRSGEE